MLFVIHYVDGHIEVCPTIIGFAWELALAGHQVEIRTLEPEGADVGTLPSGCRVLNFSPSTQQRWVRAFVSLVPGFDSVWFVFQSAVAKRRMPPESLQDRRVNIGVEPRGTITAWFSSWLSGSPFVCVSLELVPPANYRGISRLIPRLYSKALKCAEALVIQDEDRLHSFARYYRNLPSRTFLLPNSVRGNSVQIAGAGNFFAERFKLDRQRFPFIALHAGQINDAVYSQELVRAFASISSFALVLHERGKRSPAEPYLESLQAQNSTNLFLSLDPVPFEQLDLVFSSATIGLAFYRPVDENYGQVTLASGKLSGYLKLGKPVIMNALPASEKLMAKYQFGVLVDDPDDAKELAAAVNEIMSRYEFYSANAHRCFVAEFDFAVKFQRLREFLEAN